MIGPDTNVLVRYVARDDRLQSPTATRLIEQELSADKPGFVRLIVVCEVLWAPALRLPGWRLLGSSIS